MSAGRIEDVRNELQVSEPNKSLKERAYQESVSGKYEVLRGEVVESAEKECEKFRDTLYSEGVYQRCM